MKRRGITLVDTLVSFFLVGMVLMVVLQLFPGAILATREAEYESQAHQLASQTLEDTRARGFSHIPLTSQDLPDRTLDGVVLHARLTGYLLPGRNPNYIKGIRVLVWWEYRRRRHQIEEEVWVTNVGT